MMMSNMPYSHSLSSSFHHSFLPLAREKRRPINRTKILHKLNNKTRESKRRLEKMAKKLMELAYNKQPIRLYISASIIRTLKLW